MVKDYYKDVQKMFEYLETSINNRQLSTALFLSINAQYRKMQIWTINAGQGKSRCAGAAAYYFLKFTEKHVYIVFENKRLMEDDKDQLDHIMTFATSSNKADKKRLHYVYTLGSLNKELEDDVGKVIIFDEVDSIVYKNPLTFWRKTKAANVSVIGLTAKTDDGVDFGCERKILNQMNFHFYQNSSDKTEQEPKIHSHVKIEHDNGKLLVDLLEGQSKHRPVLVYALGNMYEKVKKIPGV